MLLSQQLEQNRYSKLFPAMGTAVQKKKNEQFEKLICCSFMGGQIILSFCNVHHFFDDQDNLKLLLLVMHYNDDRMLI
jgi:hypothetical protein